MRKLVLAAFVLALSCGASATGYLGVQFGPVPQGANLNGIQVKQVLPGSAAEKAGLKPGDIITQIDGILVANPQAINEVFGERKGGDRVMLTVAGRSGERMVTVTLAGSPPSGFGSLAAKNFGAHPPATNPAPSARVAAKARPMPVHDSGGQPLVPLTRVGTRMCQAYAPQGWRVTDINQQSSTISLGSPGGDMRAVYGVIGVGAALMSGAYGSQYRTPFTLASDLTGRTFNSQAFSRGAQPASYGFQVINWGTQNGFSGYTLFKAYPLPGEPRGYVLSVYIGGGTSANVKQSVPTAMGVVATIKCNTQLTPPPPNDFHPAHGATCFGNECSERDAASSAVNSILGTRYVHDPNTGEGFMASNNDIIDGPDGPGIYKPVGNTVVKMADGL